MATIGTRFSSLRIRNYRIYYIAQIVSYTGTFLQIIAQDWLVLKLTNSGTMLGLVSACQYLPMLLLVLWGGVLIDRFPKINLIFLTQIGSSVLSLFLGILVVAGLVQTWMVFAFALLLGLINCIDNPTRQAFIYEMVGKEEIQNAVGLWTSLISVTRIVGSALAGVLIVSVGIGYCFIFNAFSFVPAMVSLVLMRKEELQSSIPVPRAKGQVREGLRYVWQTPVLRHVLIMFAIAGTFSWEWQASIPLFAKFTLGGDAALYSMLTVAMSVGMIIGSIASASNHSVSVKRISSMAILFGVAMILMSYTTTVLWAMAAFMLVGIFAMIYANITTSALQLNADSAFRGRVMALWSMAFFGSTAIGGPIIGWVGEVFGAPSSLLVGGVAALVAGLYGLAVSRADDRAIAAGAILKA
jgi:MFS family permease